MIKISIEQHPHIIKAYTEEHLSMQMIAIKYNVSRMAIRKILIKHKVDTRKGFATQIDCNCTHCGKAIKRVRCQFRQRLNNFCSNTCRYTWLNRKINPFISYRHGLRLARKIIEKHFNILQWHVVHHEDRNEANNSLDNLRVFESQADHVKYHRGFPAIPIWDGRFPDKHNNPPLISEYIS
jgi:hypothetical protein